MLIIVDDRAYVVHHRDFQAMTVTLMRVYLKVPVSN
jgi:hypothetical protein